MFQAESRTICGGFLMRGGEVIRLGMQRCGSAGARDDWERVYWVALATRAAGLPPFTSLHRQ